MERDDQQGRARNMFDKTGEITGKFTSRLALVKSREGATIQDATSINERWKSYTEDLYIDLLKIGFGKIVFFD